MNCHSAHVYRNTMVDNSKMRWRQCDNAMTTTRQYYRTGLSRYRVIAIAVSRFRVVAIAVSRFRVVAIVLLRCRHRTIALSPSRCRTIALSLSELLHVNTMARTVFRKKESHIVLDFPSIIQRIFVCFCELSIIISSSEHRYQQLFSLTANIL